MPELASVNGQITLLEQAVVSVNDRGLLFGDAVYETAVVYGGRVFELARHLSRFRRNLLELDFDLSLLDLEELSRQLCELVRRSELPNAVLYWQASRGTHPRHHIAPVGLRPNTLITVRAFQRSTTLDEGVAVITRADLRWGRVDIKTTNLLPNVLARTTAHRAGAFEAVLLDSAGRVTEATTSGVMIVRAGVLIGPPNGPGLLPSITREIVEELADSIGLARADNDFRADELRTADEVLLTGSTIEVVGVTAVDGHPVADGRVGPVTRRLAKLYAERTGRLPR